MGSNGILAGNENWDGLHKWSVEPS